MVKNTYPSPNSTFYLRKLTQTYNHFTFAYKFYDLCGIFFKFRNFKLGTSKGLPGAPNTYLEFALTLFKFSFFV